MQSFDLKQILKKILIYKAFLYYKIKYDFKSRLSN